ncbi:MAG: hypothetical protein H7Z74_10380 [Anaerolineae bacterium]|nr:hypothetical protein [Gemmatimonadaceae bacterium]
MSSDSQKKQERDSTETPIKDLPPLTPSPENETDVKGGGFLNKPIGGIIKQVAPTVL